MVRLQGHLEVTIVGALNLSCRTATSPYCVLELIGPKSAQEIGKTSTSCDNCNPKWSSRFTATVDQDVVQIRFTVKEKNLFKDDKLGSCSLSVDEVSGVTFEGTIDLQSKKQTEAGQLVLEVKFSEVNFDTRKQSIKLDKSKGCVRTKTELSLSSNSKFLHGKLKVSIKKADNLPNLDSTLLNRRNKSDPFVVVALQNEFGELFEIARTATIDNNLNPEWNEDYIVDVCHEVTKILFIVYDEDILKNEKMCSLEIPVENVESGNLVDGRKQLYNHKIKETGQITLSIQFFEKSNPVDWLVETCIFPTRQHNKVRLYQDAHCCPLPVEINDYAGRVSPPANAWQDIQDTFLGAKKFICISGLNFNASIILFRTEQNDGETVGKILIDRAEAGVDVRILLWDEADSYDNKKDTAKEFFKESLVKVDRVHRKKRKKDVFHRESTNGKFPFAQNQKLIVADQAVIENPGLTNVVAYVGCFDIMSGRYDTPEHKLDSSGDDQRSQFYSHLFANITKPTSKIPFHDILCKITGPGALDVYENFQKRWETEARCAESDFQLAKPQGLFLDYTYESGDSWEVQIFRSVAEDISRLEAASCAITHGGTRMQENSIQRAYIHHIQKANQFIYIETTNFIGSSHFWNDCSDIPFKNLIPIEITMKIIEKINQKSPFTVYILMSMHPVGHSDEMFVQEVVHWQYHTIEMMYRKIGQAIKEQGVDRHPQDYLLFLTLAKREETDSTSKILKQQSVDLPFPTITKTKRSIITVNSKVAIFDDEYMIVGSSNINDRYLVGNRNAELSVGLHQRRLGSVGDISTFRKCLWSEHLGAKAPVNLRPNNLQCIREIKYLGDESFKSYLDTTESLPECHLVSYPLIVSADGSVSVRADCDRFPDTKVGVSGARSRVVAASVTA